MIYRSLYHISQVLDMQGVDKANESTIGECDDNFEEIQRTTAKPTGSEN